MYTVCFHILSSVTECQPIGKIAAHSAYNMFSWYKYLIVNLVFSHLGFWSGNLFLIPPFPDLCSIHLKEHNGEFKYLCQICARKFNYKSDFETRFIARGEKATLVSKCKF